MRLCQIVEGSEADKGVDGVSSAAEVRDVGPAGEEQDADAAGADDHSGRHFDHQQPPGLRVSFTRAVASAAQPGRWR